METLSDDLVNLFGPPLNAQPPPPPSLSTLTLEDATVPPPDCASMDLTGSTSKPPTTTAPTIETPSLEQRTSVSAAAVDERFRFELLHLGIDRRLLLNRKKQLKMYRVWLQVRLSTIACPPL